MNVESRLWPRYFDHFCETLNLKNYWKILLRQDGNFLRSHTALWAYGRLNIKELRFIA